MASTTCKPLRSIPMPLSIPGLHREPARPVASGGPGFAPPAFFSSGKISNPTYVKWNLEVQQALGSKTSYDLNYRAPWL